MSGGYGLRAPRFGESRRSSRDSCASGGGKTRPTSGGFSNVFRLRGRSAPQVDEHGQRERREQERDELRGRKDSDGAAGIAAIDLNDIARDRVEQHVKPEGSSGKSAAA